MSITAGAHGIANDPFSTSEDTPPLTTQASGSTFVAFCFGGSSDLAVSDNKGNTWVTPSGGLQAFNSTFGHGLCAYCQNATGGAGHVFTVTHSGGGLQMLVFELIGAALSGGPSDFLASNPTGAAPPVSTPSITTTVDNSAVVACAAGASNVDVAATSTNGTVIDHLSSADFVTGENSWFIKAAHGSTNDTLTFAGQTSFDMAAFTIAFAPAGGGGGATLAGTPASASVGVGALSTGIKLAGAPTSVSAATGFLMALLANALSTTTGAGALTTQIPLAGGAQSIVTASGIFGSAIFIAANAISGSSAAATLTNWSTVTLAGTQYTGQGGIYDTHFGWNVTPQVGSVFSYDATHITINPDGTIQSNANNVSAVIQFNDGTTYEPRILFLTSGLQVYADMQTSAVGALSTAIRLAAAATMLTQATGSLNGQIILQSAAQSVSTAVGALLTQIVLAAVATTASVASGTLSGTQGGMSGNAVSHTAASGALNAQIQMIAAALSVVTAVGGLSAQIKLQAAALSTSNAGGTLTSGTLLNVTVAAATAATGALTTAIKVAAAAIAFTSATGDLTAHIRLNSNAINASIASGSLTANVGLHAAAASISTAIGALNTLITMRASAFSLTDAEGALLSSIRLQGGALGSDSASGALTATGSPVGLYPSDPFFVIGIRRQYYTERFPQIGPGEVHILTFNFVDELSPGEHLQGQININVVASAGADPGLPSSLLDGMPAYDPTLTTVEQPIHNPVQDNDYYFTVTAPTSNPYKTLTRFGLLSCRG